MSSRYGHIAAGVCMSSVPFALMYAGHLSISALKESPVNASKHYDKVTSSKKNIINAQNMKDYHRLGIIVIDNVLTASELSLAREEVENMLKKNQFSANDNDDVDVRKDKVIWISETFRSEQKKMIGDNLLLALRAVRSVPGEMVSYTGFDSDNLGVPLVNQLACYDGSGANYIPHRDSPEAIYGKYDHPLAWLLQPGLRDREITIILYLNEEAWDSDSGGLGDSGHLKCYLNAKPTDVRGSTASEILSIQPIGGRMVIFNSRVVLHEVRPSNQRRIALTCWVGGEHSTNEWLRPFCIPSDEVDWPMVRAKYYK